MRIVGTPVQAVTTIADGHAMKKSTNINFLNGSNDSCQQAANAHHIFVSENTSMYSGMPKGNKGAQGECM